MQQARSGQVFSRIVVPLLLFLVVIGVVGYLIQNVQMGPRPTDNSGEISQKTLLYFTNVNAYWGDDNDPDYIKEQEYGQEDKYDFPFENNSKTELEVGLDHTSCTCNKVKIGLMPPGALDVDDKAWIDLKNAEGKTDQQVILIPVGGKGKVRVGWGKDTEKEQTNFGGRNFKAVVWIQPKGLAQSRKIQELFVQVMMVSKVKFTADKLDLGMFTGKQTGDLICWSATRDINDPKNPLTSPKNQAERGFQFKIAPLTKEELAGFQKTYLDESKPRIHSRAKSAARISAEVTADQLPFDGPFTAIRIPLVIDGQDYTQGPSVSGGVEPSVGVDGSIQGMIVLQKSKNFFLSATPQQKVLTLLHTPPVITVTLVSVIDEGNRRWRLDIVRPPNTGLSEDDNTIVMRSQPRESCTEDALSYAAVLGKLGGSVQAGSLASAGNVASLDYSFKLAPFGEGARLTRVPVVAPRP